MIDDIHDEVDRETIELAISKGYEHVKSLMRNCQSCSEMFQNMELKCVSGDELLMLSNGKISNMKMLDSIERNESLGFAALLYIDSENNITFVGGFKIPR